MALRGSWFDNPVLGLAAAAAGAGLTACGLDARQIAAGLALSRHHLNRRSIGGHVARAGDRHRARRRPAIWSGSCVTTWRPGTKTRCC